MHLDASCLYLAALEPQDILTLLNGALSWVMPRFCFWDPLVGRIFNLASVLGAFLSRKQSAVELLLEEQHLLGLLKIQVGAGVTEALHAVSERVLRALVKPFRLSLM